MERGGGKRSARVVPEALQTNQDRQQALEPQKDPPKLVEREQLQEALTTEMLRLNHGKSSWKLLLSSTRRMARIIALGNALKQLEENKPIDDVVNGLLKHDAVTKNLNRLKPWKSTTHKKVRQSTRSR